MLQFITYLLEHDNPAIYYFTSISIVLILVAVLVALMYVPYISADYLREFWETLKEWLKYRYTYYKFALKYRSAYTVGAKEIKKIEKALKISLLKELHRNIDINKSITVFSDSILETTKNSESGIKSLSSYKEMKKVIGAPKLEKVVMKDIYQNELNNFRDSFEKELVYKIRYNTEKHLDEITKRYKME